MASPDEYRKFVANAPEAQREYRTIELYHPDFTQVLRFVRDFGNVDLTLESDAPRDPSMSVTFTAIAMNITEPGESGEIEQILTVDLGAVGGEASNQIAMITESGSLVPVELIYRKFYSGDLTEPVLVLSLSVADISFKDYNAVSFTGEDINFANKRAGEIYLTERFVGLRNL